MTRLLGLIAAAGCAAALSACAAAPRTEGPGMNSAAAAARQAPTRIAPAPRLPASGGTGGGAMAATSVSVAGAPMFANRSIVENALTSPIHRTLVAAIVQAQLAETLSGPGPFTVFAPTDTAFNAVPASTRAVLMQDANRAQLQSALTYHVVAERLTAGDLLARVQAGGGVATLTTVQGARLTVRATGGGLTVTDAAGGTARVTQGDVLQSNGVIHVVDRVLMAG